MRYEGQRRLYSLNANGMNELFEFVDAFWAYPLHSLKRYFKGRAKTGISHFKAEG